MPWGDCSVDAVSGAVKPMFALCVPMLTLMSLVGMCHGRTYWSSSEALWHVINDLENSEQRELGLGSVLFQAWYRTRPVPLISIDAIAHEFVSKRRSIQACEFQYQCIWSCRPQHAPSASMTAWPVHQQWWTHWAMDSKIIGRRVARTRDGLMTQHASVEWAGDLYVHGQAWRSDQNGHWKHVAHDEIDLWGLEDSWLGAGACLGDRDHMTTRAGEHDLLGLIAAAGPDAVLVESEVVVVQGHATVVVRLGWEEPIWIYLDPEIGLAPRRIDRCLSTGAGRILIRSELEDLHMVQGGLWMPRRIVLTQHRLTSSWFEPGDDPTHDWYLRIESRMEFSWWNRQVNWHAWGWDGFPATTRPSDASVSREVLPAAIAP